MSENTDPQDDWASVVNRRNLTNAEGRMTENTDPAPTAEEDAREMAEAVVYDTLTDDQAEDVDLFDLACRIVADLIESGAGILPPAKGCDCPVSGFGYRHHRYPCARAGENENHARALPPGKTEEDA